MNTTECKHRYRLKPIGFIVEIFPMGTKICDNCGCRIHLNWFYRILYVLAYCIVPGSVFVIFNLRVSVLLIFPAALSLAFILTWLITRYGRYVLKNDRAP